MGTTHGKLSNYFIKGEKAQVEFADWLIRCAPGELGKEIKLNGESYATKATDAAHI